MAFAVTGTDQNIVITQTGTDTSLAGLAGVAGVTVAGTHIKTYHISGARLVVNGDLTTTPEVESLDFDEATTDPAVGVIGAGVLRIGASGRSVPSALPAIVVRKRSASTWDPQLRAEEGGRLQWHYGTIALRGSMHITPTAGDTLFGGYLHLGEGLEQNGRYYPGRDVTYSPKAVITGNGLEFVAGAQVSNITIADAAVIGIHGANCGTLTAPYIIQNVSLLGGSSVHPWGSAVWRLQAMQGAGGIVKRSGNAPEGTSALIQTFGSADLTVTAGGVPVPGAAIFSRDSNHGARSSFVCGTDSAVFNGVPDTTVVGTTGADGTTGPLDYLLQNWSNSDAGIVVDWRGLSVGANTRRVYVASYAHRLASTVIDMTAAGILTQPVFLDTDASVTLSKAGASGLTQVTTLDDLYDALKLWRCTSGNLEYPTVGAQPAVTSGAALDIGSQSLVLNPGASAVVSIAGGVITVKGSALAAGVKHTSIKSTGTVTATGGGVVSAPIVDANGDSYLSFDDIDSWIVYTDPARTVQIGAGVGLFRFVYAPGVTYYLKCVVGSTEFAMVASPQAAGETAVTLSTQALLTALQAKVSEVKADTTGIKATTGLIKVTVL